MQPYNFISLSIVLVAFLALIETSKLKKVNLLSISLTVYLVSAIILFTIGSNKNLTHIIPENIILKRKIFEFENCLFSIAELLFYTSFFKLYHPLIKLKYISSILTICYFTLLIIYTHNLIYNNLTLSSITYYSVYLNLFEYSILLLYCLTFFYSLIYRSIEAKPINIYVLNIICSLFFYISVSMPFFIISEKINKKYHILYNSMYVTHYMVLLISITVITITLRKMKSIFYA